MPCSFILIILNDGLHVSQTICDKLVLKLNNIFTKGTTFSLICRGGECYKQNHFFKVPVFFEV